MNETGIMDASVIESGRGDSGAISIEPVGYMGGR
jgi:hypothetical protein